MAGGVTLDTGALSLTSGRRLFGEGSANLLSITQMIGSAPGQPDRSSQGGQSCAVLSHSVS